MNPFSRKKSAPGLSPTQDGLAPNFEYLTENNVGVNPHYFQAFIAPMLRENRAWMIVFVLCLVAIGQALALWAMLPLKERVPYIIEVEKTTGRMELADKVLTRWNVSQVNVDYFLRKWITRVDSLDSLTITESIPKAATWTRTAATAELDEYVTKQKYAEKLVKNQHITQSVEVKTISYINDGKVALVRYDMVERSNGAESKRIPRLLSANVALVTPDQGSALERDNPIGLTISHFQITDEITNK